MLADMSEQEYNLGVGDSAKDDYENKAIHDKGKLTREAKNALDVILKLIKDCQSLADGRMTTSLNKPYIIKDAFNRQKHPKYNNKKLELNHDTYYTSPHGSTSKLLTRC